MCCEGTSDGGERSLQGFGDVRDAFVRVEGGKKNGRLVKVCVGGVQDLGDGRDGFVRARDGGRVI